MPKITVHGGPSDATLVQEQDTPVPSTPLAVEPLEAAEGTDYSTWTYKALLEELKARGLSRNGTQAALAERLQADDEKS